MASTLPTRKEWQILFNNLSYREKILFGVFFLIAFVSGIFILIQIDRRYSTKLPASGGSLAEGVVGTPRFINPLLAISDADRDLTEVVFASLMKPAGTVALKPELADHYEISTDGLTYTFYLRDKLYWHDDKKLTSEDIAFTINLAKNPTIRSTKFANWEGVGVETPSEREIRFHLKRPYAPFLENMTLGILPKHLWEHISPEEFSLSPLNMHPVGAGPFKFDSINKTNAGGTESYTLKRFSRYQPHPAYLARLDFHFYPSEDALKSALKSGTIESAGAEASGAGGTREIEIKLPRVVSVFLNQDNFSLFREPALRTALNMATDRATIARKALGGHAVITSLPIPPGTFGYDPLLENTNVDIESARALLKNAGFEDTDGDGVVEKKGAKKERLPASFTLATSNAPELVETARMLQSMWNKIGIHVDVKIYEQGDLKETVIRPRNYEALLFGQILGNDPDPYAFWHTSQRKHPGVNIALYANTKVDKILDEARSTIDADKRESLYKSFDAEISKDTPAVFLYSPLYTYTIPSGLQGVEIQEIPFPQARLSQISSWYEKSRSVWNIFLKKSFF